MEYTPRRNLTREFKLEAVRQVALHILGIYGCLSLFLWSQFRQKIGNQCRHLICGSTFFYSA